MIFGDNCSRGATWRICMPKYWNQLSHISIISRGIIHAIYTTLCISFSMSYLLLICFKSDLHFWGMVASKSWNMIKKFTLSLIPHRPSNSGHNTLVYHRVRAEGNKTTVFGPCFDRGAIWKFLLRGQRR